MRACRRSPGKAFPTIVRATAHLEGLLAADPFAAWELPAGAKRVVTFLRALPASEPVLPIERDGARILARRGGEVLAAYVPDPKGPVFMSLLEKSFGKAITTRTWDTVRRCAEA